MEIINYLGSWYFVKLMISYILSDFIWLEEQKDYCPRSDSNWQPRTSSTISDYKIRALDQLRHWGFGNMISLFFCTDAKKKYDEILVDDGENSKSLRDS